MAWHVGALIPPTADHGMMPRSDQQLHGWQVLSRCAETWDLDYEKRTILTLRWVAVLLRLRQCVASSQTEQSKRITVPSSR